MQISFKGVGNSVPGWWRNTSRAIRGMKDLSMIIIPTSVLISKDNIPAAMEIMGWMGVVLLGIDYLMGMKPKDAAEVQNKKVEKAEVKEQAKKEQDVIKAANGE